MPFDFRGYGLDHGIAMLRFVYAEGGTNANIMYVDAAERMGLTADVCPLPSAEVGCAIVDDYPQVGSSFITSSMPCDGSLGAALFMDPLYEKTAELYVDPAAAV